MEPSHYAGTDAIGKQETIAVKLVDMGVPSDRAFCAATALKYVERCGRKSGASTADDMEKAANYLFRAIRGRWPWEAAVETGPVRDADGVPLEVGQTVWHVNGGELTVTGLPKSGEYQGVAVKTGNGFITTFDPCLLTHRRPVPDADGVPIKVGDTVWHEDGTELKVLGFGDEEDGETLVYVEYVSGPTRWASTRSLSLTHTKPEPVDTWERVEEDVMVDAKDYCESRSIITEYPKHCGKAKCEDLVRRARALAERGE